MNVFGKTLGLMLASLALASCGGGGGNSGAFSPPQLSKISVTASNATVVPLSGTDISVMAQNPDGSAVADGTVISAQVSPANLATIAAAGSGSASAAASTTSVGGKANFAFSALQSTGVVRVTVSMIDPNGQGKDVTAFVDISISGTAPSSSLSVTAVKTELAPLTSTDISVVATKADGSAVADGTVVNIQLSPADLATIAAAGSGGGATASATTVGGRANFRFAALQSQGTVRVTASMENPNTTGSTLTAFVDIKIVGTANNGLMITASKTQLAPLSGTDIAVVATKADGSAVADGTMVNLQLSPADLATIASVGSAGGATASATTVGGRANFRFTALQNQGTVRVTASMQNPDVSGSTLTAFVDIKIVGTATSGLTITASKTQLAPLSETDVAVVATKADGSVVPDGTAINVQLSPASLGTIAAAGSAPGATATATTVGGRVSLRFAAGQDAGVVQITASMANPDVPGSTLTASVAITIGGEFSNGLSAVATATLLPPNVLGIKPFIGSPYIAEVDVTWKRSNGQLVSGKTIDVSVNPVTLGGFSTLDDPATPTINEFTQIMGQGPVNVVAGHATLFFHSFTTPGNTTMTITAIDPDSQKVLTTQVVFTIAPTAVPLPSALSAHSEKPVVYEQGSGGNNSSLVIALVNDGAGDPVPDPSAGNNKWNNVVFEITSPEQLGNPRLSAVDATGANVSGNKVAVRTVRGQATVTFESGSKPGPVSITVTADRADNNVDNGIQDPVSTTASLVVSDGKLFSVVLTSPTTNDIQVNTVSGNITAPTAGGGTIVIPPDPNGTYSLTVSALATDRQGNPVIPGTLIGFGLIDAPMTGFPDSGPGQFQIAGVDGNPQENGSLFTAPSGQFQTAGGGAGPGDTLLVFGNLVPGNRDLESARTIQTVNSQTSLNVREPFNPNDDTGVSVDSGPKLPYVIGRATEGNIGATATTDEKGVATTVMTYPVSRLGKGAYIWARGAGAPVSGTPRLVTTISRGGFAGVAPGVLVVNQTPLPGNTMTQVTVCLYDALQAPIQGAGIGFGFTNLGLGSGSIDATPTAGTFANPTRSNGCTTGQFKTSGLSGSGSSGSGAPAVIFTAGSSVPALNVPIAASGSLVLQASPSSLGGNGGGVILLLTDSSGHPVPGAQISVNCSAGSSASLLAPTDVNGKVTTIITANLYGYKPPQTTATCKFATSDGGATATVNLQGTDLCTVDPTNTLCGGTPPTASVSLNIVSASNTPISGTISSVPAGLACTAASSILQQCTYTLPVGASYTLTEAPGSGSAFVGWSGSCIGTTPTKATFTVSASATCTATFQ